MRAGFVVMGLVILIIGIFMVLMLWPLIAYETKDSFEISDVKEEKTIRYVGEITAITQTGDIYILELDNGEILVYTKDDTFDKDDNVLITIEFGKNATNWDENSYLVEKIPTLGGSFGVLFIVLGLVVMIAGSITKKLTVEDVVQFKVEPATQGTMQIASQPGASPSGQPPSKSMLSPQEAQAAQTDLPSPSQLEQVTCPKCKKVFVITKTSRPAKISCPECGLTGRLE
ncbi:MAG: zinc ribbon domain-containing protein [Thermoplasmata archaeon]|nr:MAG: zinc ribbon domain-containing protein [Thermoplasmata archaeon]